MEEFRLWQRQFETYYERSRLNYATVKLQQNQLLRCLSRTLAAAALRTFTQDMPIFSDNGEDACMGKLEELFQRRHPVYARRQNLFFIPLERGESYLSWSNRLKAAADEADCQHLTYDNVVTMFLIANCREVPHLFNKFSRLKDPDVAQLDHIGEEYDRAHYYAQDTSEAARASNVAANRVNQKALREKKARKEDMKKAEPTNGIARGFFAQCLKGKCRRCASTTHPVQQCPLGDLVCNYCSKPNHTEAACVSKMWAAQNGGNNGARARHVQASEETVRVSTVTAPKPPSVPL